MYRGCPPVREIIHSLKPLDYLHVLSGKLLLDPKEFWMCIIFSFLSVSEKLYYTETTWIFLIIFLKQMYISKILTLGLQKFVFSV